MVARAEWRRLAIQSLSCSAKAYYSSAVAGNIDLDRRPAGWLVHAAAQLPDGSVQIS